MHHRRFDFQIIFLHHEIADRSGQSLRALDEGAARVFVDNQVNVALAVFLFLVGHAVELVRQRAQRLGQQADGD